MTYTYDDFGRVTEQVTKNGETTILTESFTYTGDTDAKTTSSQVATYKTSAGDYSVTYSYEYDDNGNITSVCDGTNTVAYQYDSANQLIQEHHIEDGTGYLFGYDEAGNITQRHYCLTNESTNQLEVVGENFYSYDNSSWGDLLTGHWTGEIIYTYDKIGNPLTLCGRAYTWEHGRQLKSLTEDGTTWNFSYDADGMRTGRTDGTTSYQYIYTGSQLTQMKVGSNTLSFTYDASGIPLTVTHNGTKYYYATNLQGDVVAIMNSSGTTVAYYGYDAWGNELYFRSGGIGLLNPLRYRGYVYDQETGLYYLQSRYYDPEVGRFINADGLVTTGQGFTGNNMFAYCGNNPVNCIDTDGRTTAALKWWAITMSWLPSIDTVLPFCDLIYTVGLIAIGVYTLESSQQKSSLQVQEEKESPTVAYDEHTKGARPSTKNKHEKGQARKGKDNGGEKGDKRRIYLGNKKRIYELLLLTVDLYDESNTENTFP